MAQSLRLHFAARRSKTYPLSEPSGDDLDSHIHTHGKRPPQISVASVVQMRLTPRQTPLAPWIEHRSENPDKKSSSLQISLQPRYGGCLPSSSAVADRADPSFTCVLKDGVCSSSAVDSELYSSSLSNFSASDSGSYSSSGSDSGSCASLASGGSYTGSVVSDSSGYETFFSGNLPSDNASNRSVPDSTTSCEVMCTGPSRLPFAQKDLDHGVGIVTLPVSRNAKVPLKRCTSLVIFPRSPSNTPPASPTSRGVYHTSHQLVVSPIETAHQEDGTATKGFLSTAINGLRLSKMVCTPGEVRDVRPLHAKGLFQKKIVISNNSPKQTVCEKLPEGFSCVSVHLTQQKPTTSDCTNTGSCCISDRLELQLQSDSDHGMLKQRASPCLPTTTDMDCRLNIRGELERPNSQRSKGHAALQRSVSLGGTYPNISCLSSLKHNCSKGGPSQLLIKFASGNDGKVDSFWRERGLTNELSGVCKVRFLWS